MRSVFEPMTVSLPAKGDRPFELEDGDVIFVGLGIVVLVVDHRGQGISRVQRFAGLVEVVLAHLHLDLTHREPGADGKNKF